jgi:hypothetical protein
VADLRKMSTGQQKEQLTKTPCENKRYFASKRYTVGILLPVRPPADQTQVGDPRNFNVLRNGTVSFTRRHGFWADPMLW